MAADPLEAIRQRHASVIHECVGPEGKANYIADWPCDALHLLQLIPEIRRAAGLAERLRIRHALSALEPLEATVGGVVKLDDVIDAIE